jgi:hypothetical protein
VSVLESFLEGKEDTPGGDVTVRIECSVAQRLLETLAADMGTNYVKHEEPDAI